jgi:hypothetical protein
VPVPYSEITPPTAVLYAQQPAVARSRSELEKRPSPSEYDPSWPLLINASIVFAGSLPIWRLVCLLVADAVHLSSLCASYTFRQLVSPHFTPHKVGGAGIPWVHLVGSAARCRWDFIVILKVNLE